MTRLHDLYDQGGQSPWLDDVRREWLIGGHLAELVQLGVRGVTSNPSIFAKAIETTDVYDDQFRGLISSMSVEDAYWEMVIQDIEGALEVLRPVHEASAGADGFVSLEVAPSLAHDTDGSIAAARSLYDRIKRSNLLVKIPGTIEGISTIRYLFSEARNINVTLIFSIERYIEVAEAYLAGLEALVETGVTDLSGVHSVASFFVSRLDTEVDRRLEALAGGSDGVGDPEVLALRGKAAVAQAQVAYEHFRTLFSGERWEPLAAKGALVQRPLWASTSTKNPSYRDLLYVDTLVGPDTVNTMPGQTLDAFLDHGTVARTLGADDQVAHQVLEDLERVGIDMTEVTDTLEKQGVSAFSKSFDDLVGTLRVKAAQIT